MSISRRNLLKLIGFSTFLMAFGGFSFINQPKVGASIKNKHLTKIANSPYYINGEFQNLEPTNILVAKDNYYSSMKEIILPTKGFTFPQTALPTRKIDLINLKSEQNVLIWFGHSSLFLQIDGKKILIDPVFSNYASPVFFINKAFPMTHNYTVDELPNNIDMLIISHDYWDHLDYATVMNLKSKIKNIICPLGVGEHFRSWNFDSNIINEGQWYDRFNFDDNFHIAILPARHFSGRLLEKNQTLWASFAINTPYKKIFFSGDGGYGKHFIQIGKMFYGFDLAIMENGQYNKSWPQIHMMPEETVQATLDLQAKALLPIHCGKFNLSNHRWQEPFERIYLASQNQSYHLLTPQLGEIVNLNNLAQAFSPWWTQI